MDVGARFKVDSLNECNLEILQVGDNNLRAVCRDARFKGIMPGKTVISSQKQHCHNRVILCR
jgi:hypothetical protein